jgi:hypothetical protein
MEFFPHIRTQTTLGGELAFHRQGLCALKRYIHNDYSTDSARKKKCPIHWTLKNDSLLNWYHVFQNVVFKDL